MARYTNLSKQFVPDAPVVSSPAQSEVNVFVIDYICWHGEAKTRESDEILAASAEDAVKTWLEDNNREDISCKILDDGTCRFSDDDFDTDEELWVREDMFYFNVRVSGPHRRMTCPTCRGHGQITADLVLSDR